VLAGLERKKASAPATGCPCPKREKRFCRACTPAIRIGENATFLDRMFSNAKVFCAVVVADGQQLRARNLVECEADTGIRMQVTGSAKNTIAAAVKRRKLVRRTLRKNTLSTSCATNCPVVLKNDSSKLR